jgi:hypothetical protein
MILTLKIAAGIIATIVLFVRGEVVIAVAIVAISSMIEALESERRRRERR